MTGANLILVPAIFICFLFSLTCQGQQNNHQHNLLIRELHDAKLKISRLESVVEESVQSINAKALYLKQREQLLHDLTNKITHLQSSLSTLKDESLVADERIKALEEEVRLLWAVSRKKNFELHVLESKAEEADAKLEAVTSQVEKMAEVVTEQWIQIQHLEQALQIAEMRALQAQRQKYMRCTFLKFFSNLSGRHLTNMFWAFDTYSWGKQSAIRNYLSRTLQQLQRFFTAINKYHHELQGFIKKEMERNELTAALIHDEVVFFLASALIISPVLGAWVLLSSRFN